MEAARKMHPVITRRIIRRASSRATLAAAMLLGVGSGCVGDARSGEPIASADDEFTASASMAGASTNALGVALVRVLNATPGAPQLSLRADSTLIVRDVNYQSSSDYTVVDDRWVEFQATTPGRIDWSTLATNGELLEPGHRYSIIVLPTSEGNGYDTRVIRDDLPLDTSRASVRLLHAANDVGKVSLHLDGNNDSLIDGVDLGDVAGFIAIPSTTQSLQVRNASGALLTAVDNFPIDVGTAYTLVLATNADGAPAVFWIRDAIAR